MPVSPEPASPPVSRARDRALFAVTLAVIAACQLAGEKVRVGHGFGWDGVAYGEWAQDFHAAVMVRGVTSFQLQRILPSAVVHHALVGLGVERTNPNVILAFTLLNTTLLGCAALLWRRIADELQISWAGKCLGAMALFLNFAVLKLDAFCPVSTDVPAYTIGAALLYCYLSDRWRMLWAVAVAGAFTWPTTIYYALPLCAFPRTDPAPGPGPAPARRAADTVAFLICAAFGAVAISYLWPGYELPTGCAQIVKSLAPLSLALSCAYLFASLRVLLSAPELFDRRAVRSALNARGALGAVTLFAVLRWVYAAASTGARPFTFGDELGLRVLTSVAKPGVFFLAHALYFGPIVLLAAGSWRDVCRCIHRQGIGLTLCAILATVVSAGSESRSLSDAYPLLAPFIIQALDQQGFTRSRCALFALFSLVFCRVWFPVNTGPFPDDVLRFPAQNLFMSMGPWMSWESYVWQLPVVGLAALMLARPPAAQ